MCFNNLDGTAHFASIKAVIISDENVAFKIYNQQIALMPDVNVHWFVVVGIYFEMESAFPQNRRHNQ